MARISIDRFYEVFTNLNDYTQFEIWNEFCSDNSYEEYVYYMSDIDDVLYGKTPHEVLDLVTNDFDAKDEFFYFHVGCLESVNDADEFFRNRYGDISGIYDSMDEEELNEFFEKYVRYI